MNLNIATMPPETDPDTILGEEYKEMFKTWVDETPLSSFYDFSAPQTLSKIASQGNANEVMHALRKATKQRTTFRQARQNQMAMFAIAADIMYCHLHHHHKMDQPDTLNLRPGVLANPNSVKNMSQGPGLQEKK